MLDCSKCSNVKYYRDLSLPMGAQNFKRLNAYIDRFQNCMENNEHSMELYRELQEDPDEAEQADDNHDGDNGAA